jgi:hypothetical protein
VTNGAREPPRPAADIASEITAADAGQLEHVPVIPGDHCGGDRDERAPGEDRGATSGRGHPRELIAERRAVKRDMSAFVEQDALARGAQQRIVIGERQNPVVASAMSSAVSNTQISRRRPPTCRSTTKAVSAQCDVSRSPSKRSRRIPSQRACCCSSCTNSSMQRT